MLLAASATDRAVLRARNKLVSSANNLTFSFGTALAMSLVYIKNNSGPKTEPFKAHRMYTLH